MPGLRDIVNNYTPAGYVAGLAGVDLLPDPAKGYQTAAAGAQKASADAKALSELQWQRQMEGLQQALQQSRPSQTLYDRIYGTNTASQGQGIPNGPPAQPVPHILPQGWSAMQRGIPLAGGQPQPPPTWATPPAGPTPAPAPPPGQGLGGGQGYMMNQQPTDMNQLLGMLQGSNGMGTGKGYI